jgi:hypothetical protein
LSRLTLKIVTLSRPSCVALGHHLIAAAPASASFSPSALGPPYVRVSGTWANSVFFSNSDSPLAQAPVGFRSLLSQAQCKGVIDLAQTVNTKLVTSSAISAGVRDAAGVWTSFKRAPQRAGLGRIDAENAPQVYRD